MLSCGASSANNAPPVTTGVETKTKPGCGTIRPLVGVAGVVGVVDADAGVATVVELVATEVDDADDGTDAGGTAMTGGACDPRAEFHHATAPPSTTTESAV